MQLIGEGNLRIDADPHVQVVINRPCVREEPVLSGATAADGSGCSIYGTVIRDGGVYRMWYQAWPRDMSLADSMAVGCAESDDGITWRRPAYGLVECEGSKANHLTDLRFHCPSVFIDPHAQGRYRYRAVGFTRGETLGYRTARSADGLHWEVDPGVLWPHADVVTSVWDPAHDCAMIAMKGVPTRDNIIRRSFYLAEWSRGGLTTPALTWCADEYDDLQAHMRGFTSADYYGLGLMPMENGSAFGFLWNFRHMNPVGGWGATGRVDLSLVYRTERWGRWQHVTGRPDWLSAEAAPPWGRGALYTASTPIHVGEETRLYFTGTIDRHGACGLQNYDDVVRDAHAGGGFARIGVMSWRRDRLIGYTTLWDGLVTLKSIAAKGQSPGLALNVDAGRQGRVRARLFAMKNFERTPLEGYSFDDCVTITGDQMGAVVRWKGKEAIPSAPPGGMLVAEVELTRATLWAFEFQA